MRYSALFLALVAWLSPGRLEAGSCPPGQHCHTTPADGVVVPAPGGHDHGGSGDTKGGPTIDTNSRGFRWLMGEGGAQQFLAMPPDQRWPMVHRQLEQRIKELSESENPNIRLIAGNIHKQIDAYADQRLGEGWHDEPKEGEQRPPVDPEVLTKLIGASMGVRKIIDGADAIADLKQQADRFGSQMTAAEFKALVAKADAARERMDATMKDENVFPMEIHVPLMENMEHANNITKPLKAIGYEMDKGHIAWMQQTAPSPGVHTGAAQYHAGNRNWSEAERAAGQALDMDPNTGTALTVRAQARFEQGNYAGALQDAQGAMRVNPQNEAAHGIAQFAEGRLGDPMTAPKQGNPFAGSDDAARLAGNTVGPQAAMNAQARESQQQSNEAMRFMQLGDMAPARQALDRALEVNPANADAHAKRAWLNAAEGRTSDALADVRTILKLDPSRGGGVATKIAAELNKRGRYRDAKSILELLRPDQRDAVAWYNLAAAENGLGNRDGMLAALKRAAELDAARYGAKLERALNAASGEDLGFLFDQAPEGGKGTAGAGGAPRKDRLLFTIIAMLSGGLLLALGLLQSRTGQRWTTRVRGAFAPDEAAMQAVGVEAPPPVEPSSNVVGNFELVRQIGLGGMGIVYEGLDRTLGRRVAIKKMREEIRVDPRERERFMLEARTVAKLRHPGIVEIHSIIEKGDDVFLIFEFVDGSTVYETLDRRGRLPLKEAQRVIQQAGEALTYAHSQGIIHRDLKPSNVMISENGTVKVMDFGVARQAKDAVSKLSMTNTIVGTPPYMAPEQEQGMVCKESDVYALAVCFYELVTGRLPFQGSGAGMLLNKMNKTYAPASTLAPELPAALDSFFAKAFEPEPARRFRNVPDLLEALRAVTAAR